MQLRIIPESVIRSHLKMDDAISLMRVAFEALHRGEVLSPVRTMISNRTGTVLYKPAYWEDAGIFCQKIVSVFPGNADHELPVTTGVLQVNDANTGLPVAVLEAGYITALRTGAASGLVTDLVTRPDVKVGALFGTGGQAPDQLSAMLAVRPFEQIYIHSRRYANASRFCESWQNLAGDCELIPQESLSNLKHCDVITLATTSSTPLFERGDIGEDVHINAVGSLGPNRSEVSDDVIAEAWIVVDNREACIPEAGEFRTLLASLDVGEVFEPVEIGEIICGHARPPYEGISVFKSVGNAVQDIVCVKHVLEKLAANENTSDERNGQMIVELNEPAK